VSWSYKFLDHTADIAVDVEADSLDELFISSANSWRDSISDDKKSISTERRSLVLSEDDLEILLVSFLTELNFLYQSESWLMDSLNHLLITHKNESWYLSAELLGHKFNQSEVNIKAEIKAVTYHQMEIKEENGKFSTRIVFDI
jgi:SHS2 domain-containing protein